MLTIWDWKEEQTVLRSKAFSQEVFRVTFSTELEGQLTTSGTGHIRYYHNLYYIINTCDITTRWNSTNSVFDNSVISFQN